MNLEKEMNKISMIRFGFFNSERAISIAKQYAEEMCKKQRGICADHYHCNTWIKDLSTETYNKILNAPLATEEK